MRWNEMEQNIDFTITDSAVKRISEIMHGKGAAGFRVAVKSGGCSGFQYTFTFVDTQNDSDMLIEKEGAKVFMDKVSAPFLMGAVLTYEQKIGMSEFKISSNPNSQTKCGCGSSFGV